MAACTQRNAQNITAMQRAWHAAASASLPRVVSALPLRMVPVAPLRGARAASHGAPHGAPHSSPLAGSSAAKALYKGIFARNSTYLLYVLIGAIVLDSVYGSVLDSFWSSMNAGVRQRSCYSPYARAPCGLSRSLKLATLRQPQQLHHTPFLPSAYIHTLPNPPLPPSFTAVICGHGLEALCQAV